MSRKILTIEGYCVVSDECPLDDAELKQLADSIGKQPKLMQPNFFIDMRFDYKFVQLQALLKITEVLQPVIRGNLAERTASIIGSEQVIIHRTTNEVEIMLPISCFGIKKQYYPMLKNALMAIPTISVQYPKWSHEIKKTLNGMGALCTYVAIRKDEKDKRRDLVHFFFPIEVVSCMVSPQFGFTKLLNRSLDRFDNIYTTKIYMQICRFADKGKWIISYQNLRKLLCVGKKFGRYDNFRNRILKDVENVLMNDSNHWFTLAECFRTGAATPYLLIFNIYSAENERRNLIRYRKLKDKMLGTMLDTLKINRTTASSIIRRINIRNYEYIWKNHNQLLGYMGENQDDILCNQAYYVKTIEQIIDKEKFSQLAIQQQLF